jgi:hypothetical protein
MAPVRGPVTGGASGTWPPPPVSGTVAGMDTQTLLLLVLPLLVLDLVLIVYSLYDLTRPERVVRWLPKPVWAIIILFVSTFGAIVYLLLAREDS